MKNFTKVPPRKRTKNKKKPTYFKQKGQGLLIKSNIGQYKKKIWPNQAIQDI